MIVRGYFSHSIPPTASVFSILDAKGYCYAIAGENIGWNNYPDDVATKTVHKQFMASSGHRANIMGKRWDVVGIGAYKGADGKKMWTVLFADKCGSSGGGTTAKAPSKTTATKTVAKPRATPKPTPKPTPVPTPVRRRCRTSRADPIGLGFGPGDRGNGSGNDPSAAPSPGEAATAPPPAGSPRVLDPATPPDWSTRSSGTSSSFFLGG